MYLLSDEQISQLAYTAGGAATAPLMQDHPDYVFPDQRVAAGVEAVIADLKPGLQSVPREEGDTTVLGPEIFAAADGSVICWRGENYVRQALGEEAVRTYLDSSIRFWRGLRDGTVEPTAPLTAEEAKQKAPQYIDAYQAARVSLLGRHLA